MARSQFVLDEDDAAALAEPILSPLAPADVDYDLVVPAGSIFHGDVRFTNVNQARVLILGKFIGGLTCHSLYIAAGGEVKGRVDVVDLYSEGVLPAHMKVQRLFQSGSRCHAKLGFEVAEIAHVRLLRPSLAAVQPQQWNE